MSTTANESKRIALLDEAQRADAAGDLEHAKDRRRAAEALLAPNCPMCGGPGWETRKGWFCKSAVAHYGNPGKGCKNGSRLKS